LTTAHAVLSSAYSVNAAPLDFFARLGLLQIIQRAGLSVEHHGLVLRNERLHAHPADEVRNGAVAEHNHVAGGLARIAEERKRLSLLRGVGEELARALVDHEASAAGGKLGNAGERCYRGLREHVADDRVHIGAPGLMTRTGKTDQNRRPPCAERTERLSRKSEKREACEDEHRDHAAFVGVHAALVHEERGELAEIDRDERDDRIERDDERHAHAGVAAVPELVGEVSGRPEEEEPPHAIGEKAAKNERPGMAKAEGFEVGDLRTFGIGG